MEGFAQELGTLINYVREETEELDVISIIGMPGLGKTTLAYKVFTDPMIESLFFDHASCRRIWVNVSHEFCSKDVLLSILNEFTEVADNIRRKTEHDIALLVREHLQKLTRFFIIMDDVWSGEVWTDLEKAFPKSSKEGKILITTQLEEVAKTSTRDPLRLPMLGPDETWKLLKSEALGNSICPAELKPYGTVIAEKCGGHPLLIVMIGKVLKTKCLGASTLDAKHEWQHVSTSFGSILREEDFQNTSFYDKLPYHLRPCFLYAGMFPEGFEIPIRRLTRLWIAEGFVLGQTGIPLEKTAFEYFMDLVNRNLVIIGKRSPDGHIKTCRIHYILRQFCRIEASCERENLFQEIKYLHGNDFEPSISTIKKHRRLSITSNVNDFLSVNPSCPLVRSIMCFSQEDLEKARISLIPNVLKFLRVLEAKLITFKMLPNDWNRLALLKYVILSIPLKAIPGFFSNLRNMQTLIVYTTSPKLEIKANIWKMSQLRHVETNVPTKLPSPPKKQEGDCELQTLGKISHENCKAKVFDRLHNLRKLGICGQLDKLVWAEGLNKLRKLEKLKLENGPNSLQQLPKDYKFPSNLRNLTLYDTKLPWSKMPTLKVLINLEVLKLKKNAFMGDSWVASAGGFSQLHALHIQNHDIKQWTAPVNPFPILRCLRVSSCERLEEIPFILGDSLQKLYLEGHATASSVASARRIENAKPDLVLVIIS